MSSFCPPGACSCPAVVLWPRWPSLCNAFCPPLAPQAIYCSGSLLAKERLATVTGRAGECCVRALSFCCPLLVRLLSSCPSSGVQLGRSFFDLFLSSCCPLFYTSVAAAASQSADLVLLLSFFCQSSVFFSSCPLLLLSSSSCPPVVLFLFSCCPLLVLLLVSRWLHGSMQT